jgi:hypothetical protein
VKGEERKKASTAIDTKSMAVEKELTTHQPASQVPQCAQKIDETDDQPVGEPAGEKDNKGAQQQQGEDNPEKNDNRAKKNLYGVGLEVFVQKGFHHDEAFLWFCSVR